MKLSSWIIVVVIIAVMMVAFWLTCWGQTEDPYVEWYWTHPTTGSDVDTYTMQVRTVSAAGDTTFQLYTSIPNNDPIYGYFTVPYPIYGEELAARVKGVDDITREGPWSIWSEPFGDDGPPGITGQPQGHLVLQK